MIVTQPQAGIKIIAENRKARHEYFILDTYEAGIALTGTEVKSLRAGKCNLKDSYAQVTKTAEIVLFNAHMSRGIALTTIPSAPVSYCCIRQRL